MSGMSTVQPKAPPKRGRPFKYAPPATTLDEALEAFYAGTLPKKPRNAFERHAMSRMVGRPREPVCRTRQAAELAIDLHRHNGMSLSAATRQAAQVFGLKSKGSVWNVARQVMRGPMVTVALKSVIASGRRGTGIHDEKSVPLLAEVRDAS